MIGVKNISKEFTKLINKKDKVILKATIFLFMPNEEKS